MKNYMVEFSLNGQYDKHYIAFSYEERTKVSAVTEFIKQMAMRYYPELEQKDIKGVMSTYIIHTNSDDIYVVFKEIEGIFYLS